MKLSVSWRWMRAITRCLVRRSQPRRNWRRRISRRRRCSMGRSAERRKKTQTTSRTLNATGSEPAWRRGPRAAALEPLAEKRDGVDLERSEQVPVDAARARVRRARGHYLGGGDQEVDGQVVRQHADPLGDHLKWVDGGQDGRRLAHLAFFSEETVFQVAVAAALAEPRAVAAHRDRAAHHQIDGTHLARRYGAPVAAGAGDARRERRLLAEALRVDLDEALLGAQPRHRHVEDLALGEGEPAHRELGRVRVHFHHQRAAPHRHLAQELRGPLGAGEIGNAAERSGESRHALALNRLPDLLADLRLRHRAPASSRDLGGRYTRVCGESIGSAPSPLRGRRETACEDEEAGVRDHAMLRPHAPLADMPEADQRLERLDRPEGAVLAEAVDRLLHLERGRHEGGHHRAGAERRGGGIEKAPGLGQVDHQAIDLALLEAGEGVGGAEGPVGCGAVVAGDVVARQRREVLARLVGGEPPGGADGAQERDGEAARPGADLDHVGARPDVPPEEDRAYVFRIDGLRPPRQARDELRVGGAEDEERLAARRLHRAALREPDEGVAGKRRAAHRDAAPAPQHAEIGALLAVDRDDRLLRAQEAALPHRRRLGRGAHAGTSATAGDLFACTSRTRRQKAQSEPYAGMPQPSHCFGSSRSTWAKAGCAARRNSFTKASLVPGLAASSRLSTSL